MFAKISIFRNFINGKEVFRRKERDNSETELKLQSKLADFVLANFFGCLEV
jgi:hypothetical protein